MIMDNKPVAAATRGDIFVVKPSLPPLGEFIQYLEKMWESKILTNGGPFHKKLEDELCAYLGINQISLFTNGTIALVTALQALEIKGEVITTPFSFVATSHALLWNGIKPVFVDIDERSLNLDPAMIEAAITPQTTAILPVHCYGHSCDVAAIQAIADRHNLKLIYDAAHAFGVQDGQGSILNHGDLSILSFHATKAFHTFEGGAIVSSDAATKRHIDHLKNFGIEGELSVVAPGINGKMSELNAAMGLLQLKYVGSDIEKRKNIDAIYRKKLNDINGITCLTSSGEVVYNYSYFPVLIRPDFPASRDDVYAALKARRIHPRRYFYPLISDFSMYKNFLSASSKNLPIATRAAKNILCLPIYPDLEVEIVEEICSLLLDF